VHADHFIVFADFTRTATSGQHSLWLYFGPIALIYPALLLAAFLAWKAAWAVVERRRRRASAPELNDGRATQTPLVPLPAFDGADTDRDSGVGDGGMAASLLASYCVLQKSRPNRTTSAKNAWRLRSRSASTAERRWGMVILAMSHQRKIPVSDVRLGRLPRLESRVGRGRTKARSGSHRIGLYGREREPVPRAGR